MAESIDSAHSPEPPQPVLTDARVWRSSRLVGTRVLHAGVGGRVRDRGPITWSRTLPRVSLGANPRAVHPCGGNPNQANRRCAALAAVLAQPVPPFVRNFVGLNFESDGVLRRTDRARHGTATSKLIPCHVESRGREPSNGRAHEPQAPLGLSGPVQVIWRVHPNAETTSSIGVLVRPSYEST